MGIIEVSRSIGDGQYKSLGITSIPDIKRCQLTDDDMFILLACDGLWKVFTSEEVLQIVFDSKKVITFHFIRNLNSTYVFELFF